MSRQDCPEVAERLPRNAPGIPATLEAAAGGDLGVASLTVPYAIVGSISGNLGMVRRGASVAADAEIVGRELTRSSILTA